jgi:RNA polymerase sigma factor (sigma-70 family)
VGTRTGTNRSDADDLYANHFADLARVAYLLTGSAAAAEDAVQEVFARCLNRLAELDHPRSYLRAAVVNECRTRHRRLLRAERHREDQVPPADPDLPHELVEVRDALAALSPRQRAAVVLRYFVDLPDAEIAEILGCRPATVRSLIHRALPRLREVLS